MGKKNGFTLLELLIVMIIFSAIIAFIIPTLRYSQRALLKTRVTGDLALLAGALNVYHYDNKTYPAESNYQQTLLNAKPSVLTKTLTDPFSDYGNAVYIYHLSPNKKYYLVYSAGLLGKTKAAVQDNGKVIFQVGQPEIDKWVSNGAI